MDDRRHAINLRLDTDVDQTVTYLAVSGEIDVATAEDLASAGDDALARPGISTLVIKMAAVTFISAAGVGALISINNNARPKGQAVIVVEASPCVLRLLELTSLANVFRLAHAAQPAMD